VPNCELSPSIRTTRQAALFLLTSRLNATGDAGSARRAPKSPRTSRPAPYAVWTIVELAGPSRIAVALRREVRRKSAACAFCGSMARARNSARSASSHRRNADKYFRYSSRLWCRADRVPALVEIGQRALPFHRGGGKPPHSIVAPKHCWVAIQRPVNSLSAFSIGDAPDRR